MDSGTKRDLLGAMFQAAVDAAQPACCVPGALPDPPLGRTVVIGAGKAAAAMAAAVEDNWLGKIGGLVVTRYGHGVPTRKIASQIEVVEAAHPVPDEAGRDAARRILAMVEPLGADDLALCLISGGGSALLALPAGDISLEDKQAVNRALLRAGATISEMNCLRKHLSAIKGGRLAAAAAPARLVALLISDVPGDDPSVIASGPTVADPTTLADARAVLEKYAIDAPATVAAQLANDDSETPKPGDPRLACAETRLVATPLASLEAAARIARDAGVTPDIIGDALEGEARDLAANHADLARQAADASPRVILSGGETTVTMTGSGRGGRNSEYLLALAIALDGLRGVHAIACDTDGIDGSEDNAGAIITPDTLARANAAGLDAQAYLDNNDAYGFFETLGDLVISGPTLTNVNDFRAILITKKLWGQCI
ncbi:MAG: glycerate kinase [Alphaproteobacteria bacterium]